MDVRAIDTSATTGASVLHRALPGAKLTAAAMVLGAVILQHNVLIVGAVLVVILTAVAACRLPMRPMLMLAAYPAIFALVFAFAAAPDALTGALFVARAATAALLAVTLVFTTSYPQVFAPLQRVLPQLVGDALLMTYRALFLLAEKFQHLLTAIRLRSGIAAGHPVRAARSTATALGGLVLYSLDLAQREYDVMRLRGYEGRLRVSAPRGARRRDVLLVAVALVVLAVAVAFRLAGPRLTPLSWIPAGIALVAGGITLVWRWASRAATP